MARELEEAIAQFREESENIGKTVRFGTDGNSPVGHYTHFDGQVQGTNVDGVFLVSQSVSLGRGKGHQVNMALRVYWNDYHEKFGAHDPVLAVSDMSLPGYYALRYGVNLASFQLQYSRSGEENLRDGVMSAKVLAPDYFMNVQYRQNPNEPHFDPGALAVLSSGGRFSLRKADVGVLPNYREPTIELGRGDLVNSTGLPERVNWKQTLMHYLKSEGKPVVTDHKNDIVRPVLDICR